MTAPLAFCTIVDGAIPFPCAGTLHVCAGSGSGNTGRRRQARGIASLVESLARCCCPCARVGRILGNGGHGAGRIVRKVSGYALFYVLFTCCGFTTSHIISSYHVELFEILSRLNAKFKILFLLNNIF